MVSLGAPRYRRAAAPRRLGVLLSGCLALSQLACGPAPDAPAAPAPVLRVSTAFGPLSLRLIEEFRRTVPGLDIREHQAPSSSETLRLIQDDSVDLGVALADDAYRSYWGAGTEPTPDSRVRGVSLLQPLPMYLLVRRGSGIQSVGDLKGRVVAIGPRNTSTWSLATLVLAALALDPPATVTAVSTRDEAVAGLRNGSLDATVLPGYVYPDEQTLSAIRDGAYIVPIEGPAIDQLRRDSPFVRKVMIPRDIYPGQNRVIATVGIDMVIVCRRDLDEALVYQITQQLFNVFPRLAGIEANLRFLNVDEAPATPIPLHPGAARYFRARELSR